MVKVIVERRVKRGAQEEYRLRTSRLLASCGTGPGYLSGEIWASADASRVEIAVTTWKSREHWETWAKSEAGETIGKSLSPLLEEPARITICEVLSDGPEVHWDAQLPYDVYAPAV